MTQSYKITTFLNSQFLLKKKYVRIEAEVKEMTILTTICYLRKDHQTLLLYRNRKENDINQGKWIGIGGKLEKGESPEECIRREFLEETGLTLERVELKGYITFPGIYHGEDEGMFLYTSDAFHGTLIDNCQEGELVWMDNDKIADLPMWEGDRFFEEWLTRPGFTEAKLTYQKDHLIEKKEHHYQ